MAEPIKDLTDDELLYELRSPSADGSMNTLILEQWIDKGSVQEIVRALAIICRGRAHHIRDSSQDNIHAYTWLQAALRLESVALRIEV